MISRFVKEIHKHITTKLETKTIRQTQSIENQFDAGTLTEALQTELEGNAQSDAKNHHCLSNRFQRTPQNWKQKSPKTRSKKNSIWCRHNEPRTWNRIETEFTKSQLKHYHCSSERFLYTSRNWNQKSQRMTQSTVKQSDAGTLTQTMLSDVQRNARTFSCKILPLCVKEIPTDVKKLETKVIWKTRSTATQFDAGTLTEALQTEVEWYAKTVNSKTSSVTVKEIPWNITMNPATKNNWKTQYRENQFDIRTLIHALETEMKPNSRIVSQNIIIDCQSDSFKNHETGNKNHKDDSQYAKSIWCGTLIETMLTYLKRNAATVSYKMLSLCVKEIHKHITTKLET